MLRPIGAGLEPASTTVATEGPDNSWLPHGSPRPLAEADATANPLPTSMSPAPAAPSTSALSFEAVLPVWKGQPQQLNNTGSTPPSQNLAKSSELLRPFPDRYIQTTTAMSIVPIITFKAGICDVDVSSAP